MDIRKYLMTDSTGKKSLTTSAFIVGFLVINLKILLAGNTIQDMEFSAFSGMDYAAALGALGMIYVMRKNKREKGAASETTISESEGA